MKTDERLARRGTIMAISAGFGVMFGMLWFQGQPLGILLGAAAGLIVGAIIEYQRDRAST